MQEKHFGKLLAKVSGIDLDELNASVKSSKNRQISERMHFDLGDNLVYIKNAYEYFKDSDTHYISPNPIEHGEFNMKIASYLALKNLKEDPNLYRAISDLEDYFEYDEDIEKFLFENRYIESFEYGDGFWDYVYEINTYDELKNYFDNENLDSSGSKRDIVNRAKELNMYDDFNEFEFKLSRKGEKYFESVKWIEYYLIFLNTFDFYEFDEYYHFEDDFMAQALDFLDKHLELSFKRHDYIAYFDAQSSKALYYIVNKDYTNALNEELKVSLVRFNPISEDTDELVFHQPLDWVNINNLKNLIIKTDTTDIESLFNDIWDSMKFNRIFFDKKTSFEILIKALNSNDCEDLNPEIDGVYFD